MHRSSHTHPCMGLLCSPRPILPKSLSFILVIFKKTYNFAFAFGSPPYGKHPWGYGAKMGTQCKSATLPDAVSPILRPTNSVTGYQNHWVLKTSGKTVSARMSQKTCHLPIVTYVCGTTDMEMRFLWCYCVAISTALFVSWPCFCSGAVLLCKRNMCALWLHVSINQIVVDGPKEAPRKRHGKEILTIKNM